MTNAEEEAEPSAPLGRALWMQTMSREAWEWDILTPLTRKVWGNRAAGDMSFVPSNSGYRADLADEEETPAEPVPAPEIEAVHLKLDNKEIPRGAKTVINRAVKNGWTVEVSYARGPWILVRDWHVAGSILVKGRLGETRFAAQWLRKEWLEKDEIIAGHIMLDVWVPEQVIPAKQNWSLEVCRVNNNQANALTAGELKEIIAPSPIDQLEIDAQPKETP